MFPFTFIKDNKKNKKKQEPLPLYKELEIFYPIEKREEEKSNEIIIIDLL